MRYCTKCGEQIDDNSTFCPFCGMPQGDIIVGEGVQQPQVYPVVPAGGIGQPQGGQFGQGQFGGQPQGGQFGQGQFGGQPQGGQYGQGQFGRQPQGGQFGQPGGPNKFVVTIKNALANVPKPVMIAVPAALVVIILALVLLVGRRGASSYEKAVDNFYSAMVSGKSKKMISVMMSSKMEKAWNKAAKNNEIDDFDYDSLSDALDDFYSLYHDDKYEIKKDGVSISYKDRLSRSYLREMEKELSKQLDVDLEIKDGYSLGSEYRYREKGDLKWNDGYMSFVAYKVGSRWYVIPGDFDL